MANLMDGLLEELRRNRELAAIYDTIPTGAMCRTDSARHCNGGKGHRGK